MIKQVHTSPPTCGHHLYGSKSVCPCMSPNFHPQDVDALFVFGHLHTQNDQFWWIGFIMFYHVLSIFISISIRDIQCLPIKQTPSRPRRTLQRWRHRRTWSPRPGCGCRPGRTSAPASRPPEKATGSHL